MDFKERIFQARKAKGYSQEELAELVGVSRQAVSKWETGEAMPDLEKLIGLCQMLELSMEYLALGKIPEAPAQPPKKTYHWVAIPLAAVCLVGGFLAGFLWPRPQETKLPTQTQIQLLPQIGQNPSQQVAGPVSDVTVDAAEKKRLEVAVLPAELTDGMVVELLCEDKIYHNFKTYSGSFDGNYYRFKLFRTENYHYRITAILTVGGKKVQVPILEIRGDHNSFSTSHLWKS